MYANVQRENLIAQHHCCTQSLYLTHATKQDLIILPLSRNGNQYCVTLTDFFSKLVEAEPIPTEETKHVVAFLCKMILQHCCPLQIVSDQGREFCNHLVNFLEELTGFKHKMTSAYHPQSNGFDECFNQTLKAQLQKLANEHLDDRDDVLDNILFVYRSSQHDSTKCTPFLLMYGREARLPIDLIPHICSDSQPEQELDLTTNVQQMLDLQKKLHENALSNIQKVQPHQSSSTMQSTTQTPNLRLETKCLCNQ